MARFNPATQGKNKTVNHEGAEAYKLTPEMELYTAVVTASLQNKFYESSNDTLTRIRSLVTKVEPEFAWKLAIYAREQMHLRSIPMVLAVELARMKRGSRKGTARVIQRADELTEILSYYKQSNGGKLKPLSQSIKRGVTDAFGKFDEYQFAKYNRDSEITIRDAMFLTHPTPSTPETEALFKKITDETLAVPYTWEVQLSEAGKNGTTKKQVWEQLIDSNKVGYLALLRNLRNILEADVSPTHVEKVINYLSNPQAVKKSRVFPFQFLAAFRELRGVQSGLTETVRGALQAAVRASVENIAGFDINTRVLIASDVSGSMNSPVSEKSKMQYYDVGMVLSRLLQYRSKNVIAGVFGDTWKTLAFEKQTVLTDQDTDNYGVGYSTNGHLVLNWAIQNKKEFDKIFFFTDCQLWNSTSYVGDLSSSWKKYRTMFPNAKLYLFDLAGLGQSPINIIGEQNVHLIAGWNTEIFNVLDHIEKGGQTLDRINAIQVETAVTETVKTVADQ